MGTEIRLQFGSHIIRFALVDERHPGTPLLHTRV